MPLIHKMTGKIMFFRTINRWTNMRLYFVLSSIRNNRIGGVMVSVLASSAVDCGFDRSSERLSNWYFVPLHKVRSIKEKEQRLIGSESR